jgi:ribulose-5-phosphate 4-epimerase/fuculose-1-phosphate aldolase
MSSTVTAFRTRRPSDFDRPDDERLHRKQRLAAAFRIFGRLGFGEGVAGHLAARDPEQPDNYWVNAYGQSFRQIAVSDLVLVDGKTKTVLQGDNPVAYAATTIHSAVHSARPDVVASVHAHALHSRTWSSLGRRLDPITQDACAFFEDQGMLLDYTGVVLDDEEGRRIGEALGQHKVAILQNHGVITVGRSVDEAAWWYVSMENCCRSQLLAEAAAGGPRLIDTENARMAASQVGSSRFGWFSFQPLYDWIVAEEPDLLH